MAEIGYAAGDSALASKYFCPGARERAIERSTPANLRSSLKRRDIEKLDSLLAAGVAVNASQIFSEIVESHTDCPYGTLVDAPRHITSVLFLLNKYQNQGFELDTVLKPGMTETIGMYQIGFDSSKKAFKLVWKALPCYTKPGSLIPIPLETVNRPYLLVLDTLKIKGPLNIIFFIRIILYRKIVTREKHCYYLNKIDK